MFILILIGSNACFFPKASAKVSDYFIKSNDKEHAIVKVM
jgi:hypothetical protein